MNKLIITRWDGCILTMTKADGVTVQLDLEEDGGQSILGNIYIGKIKNIVKNINAAFVDIGNGQMGYLSLAETHIRKTSGNPSGNPDSGKLRPGDEILVQVERDAVKTKAPVLTGNLNLPGRYFVLTSGKCQLGFSAKIQDEGWKRQLRLFLEAEKPENVGIIVRTNAYNVPDAELKKELTALFKTYEDILENSLHRVCGSLLYESSPSYLSGIRDSFGPSLEGIVTDQQDIFQAVKEYLAKEQPEELSKLSLYADPLLPLYKLHQVEKSMEEALGKRVWLKSGGYLVIEPTEALVVIDVNTGKYSGKKNLHDTIMKINLEAAAEVARQLRLRNLSGIIVVDFIDMEAKEDQDLLMGTLENMLKADPVKTSVVEITKLNLVEITRKKIRRPLYEQAAKNKEKA